MSKTDFTSLGGAEFTLIYYLPIYFQSILGVSAVESGVRNLAFVIAVSKSLASVTTSQNFHLSSIQPSSLSSLARLSVLSVTTPLSSLAAQSSRPSAAASSTPSTRRPRPLSGLAIRFLPGSEWVYASRHLSWLARPSPIPKTYPPLLLSCSFFRPSAAPSWFPVHRLGLPIHW